MSKVNSLLYIYIFTYIYIYIYIYYEWVMSHIWTSHVAHVALVMVAIVKSHLAPTFTTKHTHGAVLFIHLCSAIFFFFFPSLACGMTCVTWLVQMCDMTHSYLRHDSSIGLTLICVSSLIHMCDMTHSYARHDSCICATWLCDMMTHSYVWHEDSFVCVTRHDSFICVTWLIHMCVVTYPYVWRDSFICATWLMHMCDITHSYV